MRQEDPVVPVDDDVIDVPVRAVNIVEHDELIAQLSQQVGDIFFGVRTAIGSADGFPFLFGIALKKVWDEPQRKK